MAAELDYMTNGTANMVYSKVGGTPWHNEGVEIDGDEQFDFDGIMKRHFSYPIEKRPYQMPKFGTKPDGEQVITGYVDADDSFYIYRVDTGVKIGRSVGKDYKIVTNQEAFEVLKPLIDERVAAIETGGVLREGADAWLMVRWNLDKFSDEVKAVFDRDGGIQPYSTVMTNHNGRRPVLLGNTPIRIVCANTLGAAEVDAADNVSRWESIYHNGQAGVKLVSAAEKLFSGVVQKYERIAKFYKLLMECRLDQEWFDKLVLDVVAPERSKLPNFNPEAKFAGTIVERDEIKRMRLTNLWTQGKGHTGEKNAWYAYNAVTQALDHDTDLWPLRSGCFRTASLLEGTYAELKNQVLDGLTQYAIGTAA